jgi:molecular chaperone DnaK (HSP70)
MSSKQHKNLRRVDALAARYYVGIDLGTTNSSVAYIDRMNEEGPTVIKTFMVPQLSAQGVIEKFEALPSFFYFPAGFELADGAIKLPWNESAEYAVGKFAREQGAIVPGRMISSVKSWLCNGRVDRQKKILPWNKDNNMAGFSPLEVSAYYIEHIKSAWNHEISGGDPDYFLENQQIIITVPASFDESARELTLKAAQLAGLKNITLVEEPQAAFYYWIYKNKVDWNEKLNDGDVILICDVGGGTTDFTLIHASKNGEDYLELKRVAVGDHILLGGDNMDMAIAHHIEKTKMADKPRLDALSWTSLCMKCRSLKESLLGDSSNESGSISIAGRGKGVVASTMKFSLTRDEISRILLEGFLNDVDFDSIDKKISSVAGLRESGLPYAEDPSISNQLAKFLKRHVKDIARDSARAFVRPDKILYNGGVFKSSAIRGRATELVKSWLGGANGSEAGGFSVLNNADYDLSVSLGAAYYAYAKSGSGVRIKSGSARSYYIGVSTGDEGHAYDPGRREKAVCVVTRGMEEGKKSSIETGLSVITNQPAQFALFSSTVNEGAIGDIIDIDDENYIKLPPLFTCLNYGKKSKTPRIDISLSAYLSEVGTIDLYCLSKTSEHRWKLQFNFRRHEAAAAGNNAAAGENRAHELCPAGENPGPAAAEEANNIKRQAAPVEADAVKKAEELIESVFAEKTSGAADRLNRIVKNLEAHFNLKKEEWQPDLLRALFAVMIKTADSKKISAAHEERWYNLAGFLLRPGFGAPLDDWRVKEALRVSFGGINFRGNKNSIINYYIFLRRIAGGMSAGQQLEVYNKLKEQIFGSKKSGDKPFKVSANNQELVELLRMTANFELLPEQDKTQLGNLLKKTIRRDGPNVISVWALSRIGARRLVYGGPDCVVKPETVENWVGALLEFDWSKESYIPYSAILMARVTGDRKLDLGAPVMADIQKRIETCPASEHLYDLLMNLAALDENDQKLFFGESLPHGIVISS